MKSRGRKAGGRQCPAEARALMRSGPAATGGRQFHAPGAIIGEALGPLKGGAGEILAPLSLR